MTATSLVELARLPHQAQIRAPEEDWAGVTNPVERKRLQNRLNQRLYRQRRAGPKSKLVANRASYEHPLGKQPSTVSTQAARNSDDTTPSSRSVARLSQPKIDTISSASLSIHKSSFYEIEITIAKFEARARYDLAIGSPRTDELLTLIQFNVWRALVDNMTTLGFGNDWFESEDAISPFFSTSTKSYRPVADEMEAAKIPKCLQPTQLQRERKHHPWIDLLPIPRLRDNLIMAEDHYDETDLCNDLIEFDGISHENTGLIVWDRPWDHTGWEMSERFVRKWTWAVKGCEELIMSTNFWRAKRGEPALW